MNYTRQGDNCNKCAGVGVQILYMFGTSISGLLFYGYLIYKQIKSKGNSKK